VVSSGSFNPREKAAGYYKFCDRVYHYQTAHLDPGSIPYRMTNNKIIE
jgi:hypothetical protein